ncbi:MAG: hypothetical protein JW874_02670 [Spirochaetales bacterium]|nr:hypothetical protein [Spirochaetales bacterium]
MLTIGMPAGSLADPKRGGNLIELLHTAGFYTKGYDAGGPSSFSTISTCLGWDGRPQEFGSQLGLNEIDVAIGGDDWIRERILEFRYEYNSEISLEKVMSLQRGGVRIVGIADGACATDDIAIYVKGLFARKQLVSVVSEMPYLAMDWLKNILARTGLAKDFDRFTVQKYKTPPKIDKGIIIYETWGKTESKVKNGGADLGLEITQSGSALRNYGLKIIDEIMTSETGIWINPDLRKDSEKKELLDMFLLNLSGALNAENKVLLLFNVENKRAPELERYIAQNKLFADEPTRNTGDNYTEYSLQVSTMDKTYPIPKIRYELARRGAMSIDTIPLVSSIQSMDVLGK